MLSECQVKQGKLGQLGKNRLHTLPCWPSGPTDLGVGRVCPLFKQCLWRAYYLTYIHGQLFSLKIHSSWNTNNNFLEKIWQKSRLTCKKKRKRERERKKETNGLQIEIFINHLQKCSVYFIMINTCETEFKLLLKVPLLIHYHQLYDSKILTVTVQSMNH